MSPIKTILGVVSLVLAPVLFSDPALTWGTVPPPPDFSDRPAGAAPLPGQAHSLIVVDMAPDTDPAVRISVQACVGLFNRKSGGSVFTRMEDKDSNWMKELGLKPDETMNASRFLDACGAQFPRCVRYSYHRQRELLPNILTVGAVLEAIPVDEDMEGQCGNVVFDATQEFKERDTPYLATKYVYDNLVNDTTGLAMLNPGYDTAQGRVWDPAIVKDMDPSMIDLVFSEKLFVMFLVDGCIKSTRQHDLLNEIAAENPWPKPIGVYGYADYWNVFGGYLFESQTICSDSRNMGTIASTVNNLSFFSTRRKPIVGPGELKQNQLEDINYDPTQTYVALIVGDGDNLAFMMDARAEWFRQRTQACREGEDSCPPLTWSISPHLARLAPDVLEWYFDLSHQTGKDYFMLPPSGHLYATPSSLEETTIQDQFVAATEQDARLLGTSSAVHWDWFNKWRYAEARFLPKYAKRDGAIKGLFPLNVPYLFPTFTWRHNQFFKMLVGQDGGKAVLFRPRPWRGINDRGERLDRKYYLSPKNMAKELGKYPRGTVAAVYMTSDGGLTFNNAFMELIKILPDHVQLVSADTAVKLAFERENGKMAKTGQSPFGENGRKRDSHLFKAYSTYAMGSAGGWPP